jgi:hypothetical protein
MNKRISTKLNLMDFSNQQKMIMIQIKKYFWNKNCNKI